MQGVTTANFSRRVGDAMASIFHRFWVLFLPGWCSGGRPGLGYRFFDDFGRLWGGIVDPMGDPWDSIGLPWAPFWHPWHHFGASFCRP